MSISVKVEGAAELEANLVARQQRVVIALRNKILNLELRLQSKIQGNLAQGIGLKSRHGTAGLAGSVRAEEPVIVGQDVTGEVKGAGGPTWYGRMWEFQGHKEIFPVNKKALSWLANGKRVFAMHVDAQEPRPWFMPPWQEFKPTVIAEIKETATLAGATGGE